MKDRRAGRRKEVKSKQIQYCWLYQECPRAAVATHQKVKGHYYSKYQFTYTLIWINNCLISLPNCLVVQYNFFFSELPKPKHRSGICWKRAHWDHIFVSQSHIRLFAIHSHLKVAPYNFPDMIGGFQKPNHCSAEEEEGSPSIQAVGKFSPMETISFL